MFLRNVHPYDAVTEIDCCDCPRNRYESIPVGDHNELNATTVADHDILDGSDRSTRCKFHVSTHYRANATNFLCRSSALRANLSSATLLFAFLLSVTPSQAAQGNGTR